MNQRLFEINLRTLIFAFSWTVVFYSCNSSNHSNSSKVENLPTFDAQTLTTNQTEAYTKAIETFIKAAKQFKNQQFDTIYISKRKFNQEDDFPDIELPTIIEHTPIKLVDPSFGRKLLKANSIFVNLIGWIDSSSAQFIFVGFKGNYLHIFDYTLNYEASKSSKSLELQSILFKKYPTPSPEILDTLYINSNTK